MANDGGLVIEIRSNLDEIAKVYQRDYPAAVPAAAAIAMNRALAKGRTITIRDVAKRMGIPQKFVRSRVALSRAWKGRLNARLTVRGRPLNVARFGARQLKGGVKHGAWKGGGKGFLKGAFLVKIKSPKEKGLEYFVAHRPGGGRKMKGAWGPWPVQEFVGHTKGRTKGVREDVAKQVEGEFFPKIYTYELNRQVDRINSQASRRSSRFGKGGRR